MQTDNIPVFRKVIIPWYDSEASCMLMILLMDFIFIFGSIGIALILEKPEFYEYIWVPILIMGLSGGIIVSTTARLIKRYLNWRKFAQDKITEDSLG